MMTLSFLDDHGPLRAGISLWQMHRSTLSSASTRLTRGSELSWPRTGCSTWTVCGRICSFQGLRDDLGALPSHFYLATSREDMRAQIGRKW